MAVVKRPWVPKNRHFLAERARPCFPCGRRRSGSKREGSAKHLQRGRRPRSPRSTTGTPVEGAAPIAAPARNEKQEEIFSACRIRRQPIEKLGPWREMRLGFPSAGFGFPSTWLGFPSDWLGFPSGWLGNPSLRERGTEPARQARFAAKRAGLRRAVIAYSVTNL
jgi:hypothetical protein